MKSPIAFVVLILLSEINGVALDILFQEEWESFKIQYGKKYDTNVEENFRKEIYLQNRFEIALHNALYAKGEFTYELAMNQFGDLLHHEFLSQYTGLLMTNGWLINTMSYSKIKSALNVSQPSEYVDWRTKGAVTPVKDQKKCGSCWAFSATGALEGLKFRKTKKLTSLSEQNLIDCSGLFGNHGCDGGLPHFAFLYTILQGGIDTEERYPYEGKEGPCRFDSKYIGGKATGLLTLPVPGNETLLAVFVEDLGPTSVAIDASHKDFMFYSKGIYYNRNCSTTELNHAVLAVGYDTIEGYWIVKNSWGSSWGQNGYIYMVKDMDNNCGIASMASIPIWASA